MAKLHASQSSYKRPAQRCRRSTISISAGWAVSATLSDQATSQASQAAKPYPSWHQALGAPRHAQAQRSRQVADMGAWRGCQGGLIAGLSWTQRARLKQRHQRHRAHHQPLTEPSHVVSTSAPIEAPPRPYPAPFPSFSNFNGTLENPSPLLTSPLKLVFVSPSVS